MIPLRVVLLAVLAAGGGHELVDALGEAGPSADAILGTGCAGAALNWARALGWPT